jgi:antitoxin VapB
MQGKAKIFMNNRSQAVRLPKEFQFNTQEVFIRKEGSDVVLSARPFDCSSCLTEGPVTAKSPICDFLPSIASYRPHTFPQALDARIFLILKALERIKNGSRS